MKTSTTICWQLRERMLEAGISSVQELHNRVKEIDPGALRYAYLARIVKQPPVRLNLKTLGLLARVLRCDPGDILRGPAP
jgi:DNA-binding Xre family transcriptional regulator